MILQIKLPFFSAFMPFFSSKNALFSCIFHFKELCTLRSKMMLQNLFFCFLSSHFFVVQHEHILTISRNKHSQTILFEMGYSFSPYFTQVIFQKQSILFLIEFFFFNPHHFSDFFLGSSHSFPKLSLEKIV